MRKITLILLFLSALARTEEYSPISFLGVFDGIFLNSGKTFIYNYGLNTVFMAGGTYAFVETEVDWKWRQRSYNHKALSNAGAPAVMAGGLVPIAMPISLYGIGLYKEDSKLQVTGVAVAQASIISTILTTGIKALTSRQEPHIWGDDRRESAEDFSDDFKFGFFKRVPFDGWPSGHTSAA
jgi:hypothetical protein